MRRVVAVGERAADEHRRRARRRPGRSSTSPSERAEPVSVNVRQPSATTNAASPSSETAWPIQSSRKSRLAEGLEHAGARRNGGGCLHASKAILRAVTDLLRVACVQMTSGPDKAANLETAERLVARAAATGADLVVAAGEVERDRRRPRSCTRPPSRSRAASRSRRWPTGRGAHGITLVGGSITEQREGREKLSNTSLVFDPDGELLGRLPQDPPLRRRGRRASSTASPRPRSPATSRSSSRGEGWPVGLTRLLRRPLSRALPDPRARGRRARDRPGALHDADRQGPLARAAARAGDREPVLRRRGRRRSARRCRGSPRYGRSLIVDPWGIVLAQAPDEETVIIAELDRARLRVGAREAAVAGEPPGGRVPLAGASV